MIENLGNFSLKILGILYLMSHKRREIRRCLDNCQTTKLLLFLMYEKNKERVTEGWLALLFSSVFLFLSRI